MSYYSDIYIEVIQDPKNQKQEFYSKLKESLPKLDHCIEEWDAITWYSHEDEIKHILENYPEIIVEIEGAGESAEDIWKMRVSKDDIEHIELEISSIKFERIKTTEELEKENSFIEIKEKIRKFLETEEINHILYSNKDINRIIINIINDGKYEVDIYGSK